MSRVLFTDDTRVTMPLSGPPEFISVTIVRHCGIRSMSTTVVRYCNSKAHICRPPSVRTVTATSDQQKRKWRRFPVISNTLLMFSLCFVWQSDPLSTWRQLRRPGSTLLPATSITVYRPGCRRVAEHQSRVPISRMVHVHGENFIGSLQIRHLRVRLLNGYFLNKY